MTDGVSERYGDMLAGSYDCVDRVVLNAYYPLGHSPGGFRTWWRVGMTAATTSWTTRI